MSTADARKLATSLSARPLLPLKALLAIDNEGWIDTPGPGNYSTDRRPQSEHDRPGGGSQSIRGSQSARRDDFRQDRCTCRDEEAADPHLDRSQRVEEPDMFGIPDKKEPEDG